LPLLLLVLLLLQAGLQQTLSFLAFKRLFKAGGYAYLHQVSGFRAATSFSQSKHQQLALRMSCFCLLSV
jgi:hypothetical protein